LAVEEHVLTAAVDRVDELERQPTAADDRNVRQVPEPVAIRLQMTFVDARRRRADRAAVAGSDLTQDDRR